MVVKQRQNNDRLLGATLAVLHHSVQGGTSRLRARATAPISKPFATRHSSPCDTLLTSPNGTSAVSGVGADLHGHSTTLRPITAVEDAENDKPRHTP
jgi:hypothetical protein